MGPWTPRFLLGVFHNPGCSGTPILRTLDMPVALGTCLENNCLINLRAKQLPWWPYNNVMFLNEPCMLFLLSLEVKIIVQLFYLAYGEHTWQITFLLFASFHTQKKVTNSNSQRRCKKFASMIKNISQENLFNCMLKCLWRR